MFLSFPPPTKMFKFRGLASFRMLDLQSNRLSHSEILGSNLVCNSPRLIAAYHVLRRLQEPRHPPYALSYFLTTVHRLLIQCTDLSHILNNVKELDSFESDEQHLDRTDALSGAVVTFL